MSLVSYQGQINLIQIFQVNVLSPQKKRKAKIIILLAIIWFVISLPLPWLYKTPEEARPQMYILLQMIGIISIPFVVLGIAWTIKPELTT